MSKLYESSILQANAIPDIVDEVTDDLAYLGYLDHGDLTKCLIIKAEKVGSLTTRTYPDGQLSYTSDFALRAGYTYQFKK